MSLIDEIAVGLGYIVGLGAFLLYAPIAIRILRKGHADGLSLSTWWIKILSYTFTLLYAYLHHYMLSTYIETLIISIESFIVLFLVAYHQGFITEPNFILLMGLYIIATLCALNGAFPMYLIAIGQASSIYLNCAAIIPQLHQNYNRQSSGDYSPLTASMAVLGCSIRIFTTIQLNHSDILLLLSYSIALFTNAALLGQICYYGVIIEKQSLISVFASDFYNLKNDLRNQQQNRNDDDLDELGSNGDGSDRNEEQREFGYRSISSGNLGDDQVIEEDSRTSQTLDIIT